MVALSDLSRALNAHIEWPAKNDEDGNPIEGSHGDQVYLLARVTEARVENGTIRISTSFPVPYHIRTLKGTAPIRSYVDCQGACIADIFKLAPLPQDDKRVLNVRTGQNTTEVARVVFEFADGVALPNTDVASNARPLIIAMLSGTNAHPRAVQASVPSVTNGGRRGWQESHATKPVEPPEDPGDRINSPESDRSQPSAPRNTEKIASRGGHPRAPRIQDDQAPVEVYGLTVTPESGGRIRLDIAANRSFKPFLRYLPGQTQLEVQIRGYLRLENSDSSEQTFEHPLLHGLHATQIQDDPPVVRLVLDTSRVVLPTIDVQSEHVSLEFSAPRNIGGTLAGKLIVVDPGHGGSSTGATGGACYEKNFTLAISLKLRDCLERCGARVVMTRDKDATVDLYARPRLANNLGADFFISIHNDSNGSPNSASGTSTYYHLQDASSRALAICIQQAVSRVTGLPSRGALSDGIMYEHGFAVLRCSKMPAILCEVAYINNARDRSKLADPDFQQRVAKAICDGLRAYIEGTPQTASVLPGDGADAGFSAGE